MNGERKNHIRKHPRLKNYDYSQNGCYFVTICCKNKGNILSRVQVGRDALIPPKIYLSSVGKAVDKYVNNIPMVYDDVLLDNYIIVPDHIHLLLTKSNINGGMRASRPTSLFTVVRSLKTMVTREIGYSVWQDSFYEEVIRGAEHYQNVWNYIEYNALKKYSEDIIN